MGSYIQTRNLTDSLDRVDEILAQRNARLKESLERNKLSQCFGDKPSPEFFRSWAFSAAEFNETMALIRNLVPELSDQLTVPRSERDFTIVGHCLLEVHFCCDPNGAYEESLNLADGTEVIGATVIGEEIKCYSNGLILVPTEPSGFVYFYQPETHLNSSAAEMAAIMLEQADEVVYQGIHLKFPYAQTRNLPAYKWIEKLKSEDGQYRVANFVHQGESFVDHNGFFAQETDIVQMEFLCEMEARKKVRIDGPFLVFFADQTGLQAATWFDYDSFVPA
jgi:hypothetical protein